MRWVPRVVLSLWLAWLALAAGAADFRLADGSVISGELVAPRDNGVVIRRSAGGLTDRIPWERFSVETLRELNQNPQLVEFVEVHLALADPEAGAALAARQAIVLKPVPGKLERPAKRPALLPALFGTPIGWFILAVLLAANFYAAYEIALFRNYPPLVVMAVAIVPVVGPLIFLCLPTHVSAAGPVEGEFAVPEEVANEGAARLAEAGLSGGGLNIGNRAGAPVAASGAGQVFKKADTEFNRRFFESQFPAYFRMVRGEADKHLVLHVKAGRNDYIATRITRISSNEMGLQLQIGREVMVKFADVSEVQSRPKE
ncbi:MAG: hypothetical protein ACKVYV_02890 [Limisphaerales bacterium]